MIVIERSLMHRWVIDKWIFF